MHKPTSTIPLSLRFPFNMRRLRSRLTSSWRALCYNLMWIGHKPGNGETFAREELTRAGWFKTDGIYGDMMGKAVMKMMRMFADEGHSGMSAGIAVSLFKQLADFKPLSPLTGDPDEWNEIGTNRYQNRRCSHVFKDEDGRAYDSQGIVFREPTGSCYLKSRSRVYVTFPYTPTVQYVDVDKDGQRLPTAEERAYDKGYAAAKERAYDKGYAAAKKEFERPRANGRFLPSFCTGDRVKAVRTCYDGTIQKGTVYTVTAFEPRHKSGLPCLRLEEKPEGAFEAAAFTKAKQTVHPATLKLLKRIEAAGFVKATDIESDTRKMLLAKHFCVPLKRKIGDQYVRVLQLDEPGSYALQHKGVI